MSVVDDLQRATVAALHNVATDIDPERALLMANIEVLDEVMAGTSTTV
jgi:hypothetical protein